MKHKAQELLDCLYDENKMDKFAKGFSRDDDYTSQFDYDNAERYCFDELGKFIDNSFDIRELTMIANCISVACFNGEVANTIMDKLIKQKEMWEEE